MGDLSSTQMQAELQRRVAQLSVGAGSAALAAINRSIRWIQRQGSYTFQLAGPTTLTCASGGTIALPLDVDPGKAILLTNVTNGQGLPIVKGSFADLWEARNFVAQDQGFDRYMIVAAPKSSSASVLHLFPTQSVSSDVSIRYHRLSVDLSDGSGTSNLPRDFDDLVIDLAEAEERRINDIGDTWAQTYARCQDQIKVLLDAYRSTSMESGPGAEAQSAVAEKTQVGRP